MSRNQSLNFKKLVESFHAGLFRFAYCLCFDEQTASDLTQHTFFIYANKGTELRDSAKLKLWFYSTLYHEYVRQRTAPQLEPRKLPAARGKGTVKAENLAALDGTSTAALFESMEEPLRAPLALFYLRDLNYREMAEVLATPIPELLQRVALGKNRLKEILTQRGQYA
jgi:RNA polymerase sigma-70 factor (ECF subfamily)